MKKKAKETQCVHYFGEKPYESQGINTPVEPASAFKYGEGMVNVYPRYFNTYNQKVINSQLASLEGGEDCLIFGSGMAAITTALFSLLNSGDHAVFYNELYGGTFNLLSSEFEKKGISFTLVNKQTKDAFEKAIQSNTKVLYFESPTNPLLSVVDIKLMVDIAKANGLTTLIDNTFASPINQNPIEFGVDIVLHSGTKYLGGHSDLSFGAIVSSNEIIKSIHSTAINLGGSLNPFDCYLIERSIKTLDVRVKRHNENALALAEFLDAHDKVKKVYYPGLVDHDKHEIAKSQMKGFGGMLSFELATQNQEDVNQFVDSLQLVCKALSLGGVESTICSPALTSHIKMTKQEREAIGVTDGLLRLSVGIENINDLKADFENALKVI
ncbi:trans-sulfuration enzyme family protein [Chondrinema litorale]|uniref:trans-sulfuration enzyme family protein n=1 Tax=Chondrinema litorale TaxID=2994555 RepID=UPI0025436F70|nr:PLP-dependent aspartate aminotransferase family protein [Chondrinema litorale]UZR92295.1 PLP-dependent aspartate aminotransferase family protein [Chondrinema litorale]